MARNIYVGTTNKSVTISTTNIDEYFTVTHGDSYYFIGNGTTFSSNNYNINYGTAKTTLTAKTAMNLSFGYSYDTESGYDKFTITVAGTTVLNAASGVGSSSWSGSLAAGASIVFTYTKDKNSHSTGDVCKFSNMVIALSASSSIPRVIRTIYVGVNGVARKVKKVYIGDSNGKARLCYPDDYDYCEMCQANGECPCQTCQDYCETSCECDYEGCESCECTDEGCKECQDTCEIDCQSVCEICESCECAYENCEGNCEQCECDDQGCESCECTDENNECGLCEGDLCDCESCECDDQGGECTGCENDDCTCEGCEGDCEDCQDCNEMCMCWDGNETCDYN